MTIYVYTYLKPLKKNDGSTDSIHVYILKNLRRTMSGPCGKVQVQDFTVTHPTVRSFNWNSGYLSFLW